MNYDLQHSVDKLTEGIDRSRQIGAALSHAASVIEDAKNDLDVFEDGDGASDVRFELNDALRGLTDVRQGWLSDYRRDARALMYDIQL